MMGVMEQNDKAFISIYDNLTHTVVLEKEMEPRENTLSYTFSSADTKNLEPDDRGSRYSWDITIKRGPVYDENNQITHYETVDSYYSAFSLPACVIKRVTHNV